MGARRIFLVLFLLLVMVMPAASVAQLSSWMRQDSYDINVDQMVNCFGIVNSDRLVEINVTPVVTMKNPLVIQGSGAGILEVNSFNAYVGSHALRSDLLVGDGVTSYGGKPLSDYDLVLIGGPGHNQITNSLVEQGILQYEGTDIKMPGLVIEVANMSNGHKVIVIGEVSGWPYHKKDLPLNGILPESLAPAAAIATGMCLGVIGGLIGNSGAMISFRRRLRKMTSGYLNAQTAEAASETGMAGEGFGYRSLLREMVMLVFCAILFLPFALIGGVAGQIAVAGFIMNLMTAVYNLMPFSPMDGKVIYDWSRLFWMLTFMPLALFFILMTLFFV